MNDIQRYVLWVCGQIDPRNDQALYGVYHLAREGEGRTLCGQQAAARETKSTLWWAGDYGRPHWNPEAASCNRCRKIAGLAPVRESKVML